MANFEYLDKAGLNLLVEKIKGLVAEAVGENAAADALLSNEVAKCFDGVEYKENKIVFKHGEEELGEIDATDFVKDGMIEAVEVKDGKLVITFNTDAGKEEIELDITEIFDASNYYTKAEVDAELAKKVKWTELEGKKAIEFSMDDQILGADSSNMLQMRKYASVPVNCVEVGSTTTGLILNSVEGMIAIDGGAKQEFVATKSDIEKATEDVVKYTPFENRKTIALAEGDTISSLGVNLGMVKTYEGLQYGENCNPAFTGKMPVLEVGGQKGALVLNTCEDRVKVEVWNGVENKREQHAIATLDDFSAIETSFIEGLF